MEISVLAVGNVVRLYQIDPVVGAICDEQVAVDVESCGGRPAELMHPGACPEASSDDGRGGRAAVLCETPRDHSVVHGVDDVDDATAWVEHQIRRPIELRNLNPRTAPTSYDLPESPDTAFQKPYLKETLECSFSAVSRPIIPYEILIL